MFGWRCVGLRFVCGDLRVVSAVLCVCTALVGVLCVVGVLAVWVVILLAGTFGVCFVEV